MDEKVHHFPVEQMGRRAMRFSLHQKFLELWEDFWLKYLRPFCRRDKVEFLQQNPNSGIETNIGCPFCHGHLVLMKVRPEFDWQEKFIGPIFALLNIAPKMIGNTYEFNCSNHQCSWVFTYFEYLSLAGDVGQVVNMRRLSAT